MAATPGGTPVQHSATAAITVNSLSHLSQAAIDATAQIAARITRALDGRSTRFDMALTPDDLGRVDVSLSIDKDGRLAARMAFDNPLAATELRGRADELRRQLEDAGFTIAHDGFDFSERQPGSSDSGFGRRQQNAFAGAAQLSASAEAAVAPPVWMSLSLTPQGVDVKV